MILLHVVEVLHDTALEVIIEFLSSEVHLVTVDEAMTLDVGELVSELLHAILDEESHLASDQ